ncbi:hypothetical protein PHLCEN_2v9522 [Hermanssonia centrifuga]|uniref:Uncharacterized protein n=1 Tax=Hermanssonia centrifuga TaxID=98765 RepID=A0A2R6NQG9_9APHY|nr:hypothetical protein PHLCEN_2v9522 [Hermanssonia centrifuga]
MPGMTYPLGRMVRADTEGTAGETYLDIWTAVRDGETGGGFVKRTFGHGSRR